MDNCNWPKGQQYKTARSTALRAEVKMR